jgi:hypothetical protein
MNPTAALPYEPKPRDFSARQKRSRVRSLRAARQRVHTGRRAAVLLAAVAVPAFAAPGEWSGFAVGGSGPARAAVRPMPFETPGGSFPGSAFYYLVAGDPGMPLAPDIHSDADPGTVDAAAPAGPAARAMRVDNSGVDRSRALQCLTAAIYYEAASEPDAGQRAVAQVVLNRVAHPAYPKTVCGVVFQGSERRTGCQFSFTCDGSMARVPNRLFWERAETVARAALSGYVFAPIGLATHYHTVAVHPYWADSLAYLGTIGAHRFYRFGGAAGRLGTFRFAYAGGEPLVGSHAGRASAGEALAEATVDPVAVQAAYDAGLKTAGAAPAALAAASPAPTPSYTAELEQRGGDALYRADKLPGSTVRPEYENSGRWLAQPGS